MKVSDKELGEGDQIPLNTTQNNTNTTLELRKGLGYLSSTLIGISSVAILTDVVIVYGQGLTTGGPVVIIWGYIVSFFMNWIVSLCMAEICAVYPHAGGVYHWAAQVVPKKHSALASYITGWFNYFGLIASKAVFAATFAGFLNAAIIVSNGRHYTLHEQVAVAICTCIIWSLMNVFRIDEIAIFSFAVGIFHTITVIIICFAVLLIPNKLNSTKEVFTEYHNETGFTSEAYVVAIGLIVPAFCMLEYDAAATLAEDTQNAETNAPRSIISTVISIGFGGLGLFITFLYATIDIDYVLHKPTDYAVINLFDKYMSPQWASALAWLLVINIFFSGASGMSVAGRMAYALARDNGLPFSYTLSKVHGTFRSPIGAVFFTAFLSSCLLLLLLNPEGMVAFNSLVGMSVIGILISYALPILLKLVYKPTNFPKTRFSLGVYSTPLGVLSCTWLFTITVLAFFPMKYPYTVANFNWSFLVLLIYLLLSYLNWTLNARHSFRGPISSMASSSATITNANANTPTSTASVEHQLPTSSGNSTETGEKEKNVDIRHSASAHSSSTDNPIQFYD